MSEAEGGEEEATAIAGLGPKLSLFNFTPSWVDKKKPPGHTSQPVNPQWRSFVNGAHIIYSPNLIWLIIALGVYFLFPYDYDVSKKWDKSFGRWIAKRAILNLSLVYTYYGFWHSSLYCFNWANRPFNQNRPLQYRWGKLLHNVFYTTLGALQWTGWEVMMLHCYASGKMPYLSNEEAFSSSSLLYGVLHFVAWSVTIPIFREVHFYFVHRFVHLRVLYTYVHSVHHRNTDVEPFSGLCMHPVEHMYYFTSIAPSLYFNNITPFAFLWNGIHLIISPGAAHSGYEDHWHSDQYHYLHHRYFECNYGTPSFVIDKIFGTFRDKVLTTAKLKTTYRGEADEIGTKEAIVLDSKATLLGWPDWYQLLFNIIFCTVIPILYIENLISSNDSRSGEGLCHRFCHLLPVMLALGPIAGGVSMFTLTLFWNHKSPKEAYRELTYPFHKEGSSQLALHILIGFVLGVLPAYTLFSMTQG